MSVRYKCSYCEKQFIGDYGQEGKVFVWCSKQCRKEWQDRFEKNLDAYVEMMKRSEKNQESQ